MTKDFPMGKQLPAISINTTKDNSNNIIFFVASNNNNIMQIFIGNSVCATNLTVFIKS